MPAVTSGSACGSAATRPSILARWRSAARRLASARSGPGAHGRRATPCAIESKNDGGASPASRTRSDRSGATSGDSAASPAVSDTSDSSWEKKALPATSTSSRATSASRTRVASRALATAAAPTACAALARTAGSGSARDAKARSGSATKSAVRSDVCPASRRPISASRNVVAGLGSKGRVKGAPTSGRTPYSVRSDSTAAWRTSGGAPASRPPASRPSSSYSPTSDTTRAAALQVSGPDEPLASSEANAPIHDSRAGESAARASASEARASARSLARRSARVAVSPGGIGRPARKNSSTSGRPQSTTRRAPASSGDWACSRPDPTTRRAASRVLKTPRCIE